MPVSHPYWDVSAPGRPRIRFRCTGRVVHPNFLGLKDVAAELSTAEVCRYGRCAARTERLAGPRRHATMRRTFMAVSGNCARGHVDIRCLAARSRLHAQAMLVSTGMPKVSRQGRLDRI